MRKLAALIILLIVVAVIPVAYATESTIWEDDAAFWAAGSNTVLTGEYTIIASGEYSVNITTTGTGSMSHTYGVNQDFTPYLNYTWYFWWYGNATGATLYLNFYNSSYIGGSYPFYDNYRGWHLYSFQPNEEMAIALNFDWTTIKIIQVSSLDTTNKWFMDRLYFDNEGLEEEVTAQMISSDWLTFSALMALSLVCLLLAWKSNVPIINFVFGVVTLGTAAYYLGSNIVFAGWINILAILMASLCMLSGGMRLRET